MAETKVLGVTINTSVITNLPDMYKIIAGGVLAGGILFGAAFYLVYPVYQDYQTLLDENAKLTEENQATETKLGYNPTTKRYKKIDDLEEEMKTLTQDIKKVQTRIPIKENLPTLIYDLERIVEVNNKSDLLDMVPASMQSVTIPASLQAGKPTGLNLKQIPINMSLESSYPSLINLFKDLERYERAVSSTSLFLSPLSDTGNKFSPLKVSLNLKAYVLPEGGN